MGVYSVDIFNFIKKVILDLGSKPDYKDVIRQVLYEYQIDSTEYIKNSNTLPDYTCPKLDKILKELKSVQRSINSSIKCDEIDEFKSIIEDIDRDLCDTDSTVEEVRVANSLLRDCAINWKCKYEELETFVTDVLEEIIPYMEIFF